MSKQCTIAHSCKIKHKVHNPRTCTTYQGDKHEVQVFKRCASDRMLLHSVYSCKNNNTFRHSEKEINAYVYKNKSVHLTECIYMLYIHTRRTILSGIRKNKSMHLFAKTNRQNKPKIKTRYKNGCNFKPSIKKHQLL